eukprot:m.127450 g.127450  ORF g.127450 m.127450 type:complete len:249 (-) comp22231_c0_seq3:75-821(-)
MWALYILSWVSSLLLACFGIVCIASGLYFLAETVEEYSVATKQLLNFAVVACTFCNLLVGLVEPIPIWVTVVAVVAHGAYLNTLQTFPVLETGPSFYASCLLILLHNYLAFTTFADTWFPFDEVCHGLGLPAVSNCSRPLHAFSVNRSTHQPILRWTCLLHSLPLVAPSLRAHDTPATESIARLLWHIPTAVSSVLCDLCLACAVWPLRLAVGQRQCPPDTRWSGIIIVQRPAAWLKGQSIRTARCLR